MLQQLQPVSLAKISSLEHSNWGKKSFDLIRFDYRYRINFSIRFGNKFAACTLVFK